MNIEHILSLSEGKTVEFKENSAASHNIIKTLVSVMPPKKRGENK